MSEAIHVERLSKQYRIGKATRETMLREHLSNSLRRLFRRGGGSREETIWALRDVSFKVESGEVVGFVGRNGAGKSTLLKVLSRITVPTSGRIHVNGRIGSLLEVGTGFHEELTGLENIYMNGSILGMSKREVERKLDAIIEFSGVSKFLDTPIKRYSSGMRLRLGFAVAAHLDPDILIVDEVLAVGDAQFQKKCLSAMEDMRGGGRTVLFVSHNLAAVENLCTRCVWIDNGTVRADGEPRQVLDQYLTAVAGSQTDGADLSDVPNRGGTGLIRFTKFELLSPQRQPLKIIRSGDPLVMRFSYRAKEHVVAPSFGFRLRNNMGTLIAEGSTWHHGIDFPDLQAGEGSLDLDIDCVNLLPGNYGISLWLTGVDGIVHDHLEHAVTLEVENGNVYGSGKLLDSRMGIVYFPQKWDLTSMPCSVVRAGLDYVDAV